MRPAPAGRPTVNLRGLGALRTLVLLDGRRMIGLNADGTVDLNLIPDALIQSVETITGGASTVYGSDAMSGVVNFKLVKNVKGIVLDAQSGIFGAGDGPSQKISIAAGTKFAEGRGNFFVAYTFANRALVHKGDRPFFARATTNTSLPDGTVSLSANPPSQAAVNALFAKYGYAPGSALRTQTLGFNSDGTLFTSSPVTTPVLNYKGPNNADALSAQGTAQVVSGNSVLQLTGPSFAAQNQFTRHNVYAHADYDLGSDITAYLEGGFTQYSVFYDYYGAAAGGLTSQVSFPVTNPFIPADLSALLASRASPNDPVSLVKQLGNEFGRRSASIDTQAYQIIPGLRGKLPFGDWTFDGFATVSRIDIETRLQGGVSQSRFQAILNAADGGRSLCTGGYNPFGNQINSQSCIDYLKTNLHSTQQFKQTLAEVDLTGTLFTLPAGPVQSSFGSVYRHNSFATNPDPLLITNDAIGFNGTTASSGQQTVKEIYGEVRVPLIHDTFLIKTLEIGGAYRYSTYGRFNISTYKADFEWSITDSLRLRGGYNRAGRAPSLAELYNSPVIVLNSIGNATAGGTAGDPCDVRSSYRLGANASQVRALCVAQGVPSAALNTFSRASNSAYTVSQGNQSLCPEKADTYSIGAVWRSHPARCCRVCRPRWTITTSGFRRPSAPFRSPSRWPNASTPMAPIRATPMTTSIAAPSCGRPMAIWTSCSSPRSIWRNTAPMASTSHWTGTPSSQGSARSRSPRR